MSIHSIIITVIATKVNSHLYIYIYHIVSSYIIISRHNCWSSLPICYSPIKIRQLRELANHIFTYNVTTTSSSVVANEEIPSTSTSRVDEELLILYRSYCHVSNLYSNTRSFILDIYLARVLFLTCISIMLDSVEFLETVFRGEYIRHRSIVDSVWEYPIPDEE